MKKLISLLIAVLMVFGLLPVLSAPATHASADSSDGYGDSKPPRIRLIHFADSAIFTTTQNSWAGLTAGSQWRPAIRKAQASYPTLRKAVTLPVNFTTATFTAIAMRRKAITTSAK